MAAYPPLACERITFRAILYPEWVDKKGLPKWQNFKRRKVDDDGVSLGLTVARCVRDLDHHEGVVTVHVGHVRAAGDATAALDVIQDESEHAIIAGLPYPFDATGNPIPDFALNASVQHLARRILEHVLEHIRKHPPA